MLCVITSRIITADCCGRVSLRRPPVPAADSAADILCQPGCRRPVSAFDGGVRYRRRAFYCPRYGFGQRLSSSRRWCKLLPRRRADFIAVLRLRCEHLRCFAPCQCSHRQFGTVADVLTRQYAAGYFNPASTFFQTFPEFLKIREMFS